MDAGGGAGSSTRMDMSSNSLGPVILEDHGFSRESDTSQPRELPGKLAMSAAAKARAKPVAIYDCLTPKQRHAVE